MMVPIYKTEPQPPLTGPSYFTDHQEVAVARYETDQCYVIEVALGRDSAGRLHIEADHEQIILSGPGGAELVRQLFREPIEPHEIGAMLGPDGLSVTIPKARKSGFSASMNSGAAAP